MGPEQMLDGVSARLLRLALEIEIGAAPVRGWLRRPSAPARRFESWLDLVSALDEVIDTADGTVPDPTTPTGTRADE